MAELKIGDIVGRKSYGCDVFFKVVDIREEKGQKIVTLKGICYRIEADAPEADLEIQPENKVNDYRSKTLQLAERRPQNKREGYGPRYGMYQKKHTIEILPKIKTGE